MRLRHADPAGFKTLKSKIARWSKDHAGEIASARPRLPEVLSDRAHDNWEPLLGFADAAGAPWPQRARRSAVQLSANGTGQLSYGVQLLSDIWELLNDSRLDRISSKTLIDRLTEDQSKRWGGFDKGKGLTPYAFGRLLNEFSISIGNKRFGAETLKGYHRSQFDDAFALFLPPPHESVTPAQSKPDADLEVPPCEVGPAQLSEDPSQVEDYVGVQL